MRRGVVDSQAERPDEIVRLPYFFYLLLHERGPVLFDTGASPVADGSTGAVSLPRPEDSATHLLQTMGIAPGAIRHIVMSHLHYDHAGGMRSFHNARFWLQHREWEAGQTPPDNQSELYHPETYALPPRRFEPVDGVHDLFGDGTIRLHPTPGHSPGHQSLVLRGAAKTIILAADALVSPDPSHAERLPARSLVCSPDDLLASRRELFRIADETGAQIICTHDLEFESRVRIAPEGYIL